MRLPHAPLCAAGAALRGLLPAAPAGRVRCGPPLRSMPASPLARFVVFAHMLRRQLKRHLPSPPPQNRAVFGYNDAFCKLQPFLRKWRAAAGAAAAAGDTLRPYIGAGGAPCVVRSMPSADVSGVLAIRTALRLVQTSPQSCRPPAPAVSVDVSRAFDHVGIPLLLSLVEPLLRHEQYLVLKYCEVRGQGTAGWYCMAVPLGRCTAALAGGRAASGQAATPT